MPRKQDQTEDKPKRSTSSRYASKKAYFARNTNGAITKKNKARKLTRAKRRKTYWATPESVARKAAKLNTPGKVAGREQWHKDRDARRRERRLAEQQAKTLEAQQNADQKV
jgi:hypothetical protein